MGLSKMLHHVSLTTCQTYFDKFVGIAVRFAKVLELTMVLQQGGVYAVKPLCAFAMLDGGELDWKVVAIRTDDPLAAKMHDAVDVETMMPVGIPRNCIDHSLLVGDNRKSCHAH